MRVGSRIVEVSGKSITAWNVLQAIRDHLDRKGMDYIIDPTDEQYRTL